MGDTVDVLVVGAGVIGLSIAWRCRQRGLSVTVVDPAPGSGATTTAAGMLAPVTELHFGEQSLLRLNLASAARYPDFVAELTEVTGLDTGYDRTGTLAVAWDAADLAALHDLRAFALSLGQAAELVTGRQLRQLEPALAAGLPGGLLAADDHQIDNRLLHTALLEAARRTGVEIVAQRVGTVSISGDRVTGAVLADGTRVTAQHTVLATGAWSAGLSGLEPGAIPAIRPVKGQTLRLRTHRPPAGEPGLLRHIVRGAVKGNPVYVIVRRSGEIVIGASSEEAGFDSTPRAGVVYELLRDAQSLVPELSEAEFCEVSTSFRPGSPDNAPIIGPAGIEGLIVATGHYRNGILLTPVTADSVAELLADGTTAGIIKPFGVQRFALAGQGAR